MSCFSDIHYKNRFPCNFFFVFLGEQRCRLFFFNLFLRFIVFKILRRSFSRACISTKMRKIRKVSQYKSSYFASLLRKLCFRGKNPRYKCQSTQNRLKRQETLFLAGMCVFVCVSMC